MGTFPVNWVKIFVRLRCLDSKKKKKKKHPREICFFFSTYGGGLKQIFYRSVSVWMLKSDFKLYFPSLLMRHTMVTSKLVPEIPELFIQNSNGTSKDLVIFLCDGGVLHRNSTGHLCGERDDAPPFLLHPF